MQEQNLKIILEYKAVSHGVAGQHLPWTERRPHVLQILSMHRLIQKSKRHFTDGGKLPASNSHCERPRGTALCQMSIWSDFVPLNLSILLGTHCTLAKWIWSLFLDLSIRASSFHPQSITLKKKKNLSLSVPKTISWGSWKSCKILCSKPVGFFQ